MKKLFFCCQLWISVAVFSQDSIPGKSNNYLDFSWKKVATQMPAEWYAAAEAKKVAETVLYCQQDIGGWAKNKPYHHPLTAKDSAAVESMKYDIGATIDNGATTMEMHFLAKIYKQQPDERYAESFRRGLNYLFKSQYSNGGWPQFYPFRKGNSVNYASHITFNDNAIVNVLLLLRAVSTSAAPYDVLPLSPALREKASKAYEKGIDCILKTQIMVKGQPTVWCAQHDELTLLPANARAYELASFSGQESMGIVQLLMDIQQPDKAVIKAVKGAMQWMEEHKITGIRIVNKPGPDGKKNIVLEEDKNAPVLLARFYDLDSGRPFFCDRDGIKKNTLAEIGSERRNGYSWYSQGLEALQNRYQQWLKKWNIQ